MSFKILPCGTHCPIQYKLKTNGFNVCPYIRYKFYFGDLEPKLFCDKIKKELNKGDYIPEGCSELLDFEEFRCVQEEYFTETVTPEMYQNYLKTILQLKILEKEK